MGLCLGTAVESRALVSIRELSTWTLSILSESVEVALRRAGHESHRLVAIAGSFNAS